MSSQVRAYLPEILSVKCQSATRLRGGGEPSGTACRCALSGVRSAPATRASAVPAQPHGHTRLSAVWQPRAVKCQAMLDALIAGSVTRRCWRSWPAPRCDARSAHWSRHSSARSPSITPSCSSTYSRASMPLGQVRPRCERVSAGRSKGNDSTRPRQTPTWPESSASRRLRPQHRHLPRRPLPPDRPAARQGWRSRGSADRYWSLPGTCCLTRGPTVWSGTRG